MKLRIVAALAVASLCFLSVQAQAGPIRDRINEARPGILFPKRAGGCQSCPGCSPPAPAPAPAPISDPGLGISPDPRVTYYYAPQYQYRAGAQYIPVGGSSCPGGKCPTR